MKVKSLFTGDKAYSVEDILKMSIKEFEDVKNSFVCSECEAPAAYSGVRKELISYHNLGCSCFVKQKGRLFGASSKLKPIELIF